MIFLILLSSIIYVYAEYHLTTMLISSPKKIPMLTFTIEYFLNAYNYNHDGFVIDSFYLTKGCEGDHPEIYKVANQLKSNGIPVHVHDKIDFYIKDGTEMMKKMENYQSWIENNDIVRNRIGQSYDKTLLYMKVNSYFNQTLNVIKEEQGYPEYILFLEDDVAFQKSFFINLRNKMVMEKKFAAMKVAFPPNTGKDEKGFFSNNSKGGCPWGFWGLLMNRKQLKRWELFHHYVPHGMCADRFACELVYIYDKKIKLNEYAYHFGRDSIIKRREKRFWNK